MTDNRHAPEKPENQSPSQGNLGQKKAEREETADEKLDHLGHKDERAGAPKSRDAQEK